MAHKVTFEIPSRPVGFADIVSVVRKNNEKFGELRVSKGAVVWFPKLKWKARRLTWTQIDDPTAPPQRYDARFTADLHVGFKVAPNLHWTIGGTNIFDAQPTEQDPFETENGALWENVQMGINGAAYYTRLSWKLPAR